LLDDLPDFGRSGGASGVDHDVNPADHLADLE
jgi:hypothetical protein